MPRSFPRCWHLPLGGVCNLRRRGSARDRGRMLTKLAYLREQAAAYWRDAEAQTSDKEALRLTSLAIGCQELILERQYGTSLDQPR
jgi:hypothetical protein